MNESNELKNLLSTLKIKSNAEVDDKNNPKENYLNNQNDSANINRNFLHLRYCLFANRISKGKALFNNRNWSCHMCIFKSYFQI